MEILQQIYSFYGFTGLDSTKKMSIDLAFHRFYDAVQLQPRSTIIEIRWLKKEENISIKGGSKAGQTVTARKLIYFDYNRNEIGSALIFHDKYAIIKLLQINNLVEVPLVVKDNRTFLDFTDLVKIRLVDGYALFKLKILNKEH